jgi:hypothetical protein
MPRSTRGNGLTKSRQLFDCMGDPARCGGAECRSLDAAFLPLFYEGVELLSHVAQVIGDGITLHHVRLLHCVGPENKRRL